jgi:hypothetical protein
MLSLSPFLNNGFTIEYFKREGKLPEDIDLLQIWLSGEQMYGALIFSIFVVISSYPCEFFTFIELIILSHTIVILYREECHIVRCYIM